MKGPTALLGLLRPATISFLGFCIPYICSHCTQYTTRNMHERSWTLILAPALLIAFTVSPSFAFSYCDASLYGNPSLADCSKLLFDNRSPRRGSRGLERLDGRPHLFYTEVLNGRPYDSTPSEWKNQVHLPKTLSSGQCSFRVRLIEVDVMTTLQNRWLRHLPSSWIRC